MLSRIITKLVGWAVSVFYRVERTGPPMPDGPVLVTANHPNALVDPLVVFRTGGRPARPLAKAPLFEQLFVGTVLKGLGGLPVYRRQDHPDKMHLNDTTFDAAITALHDGQAVQIYPEGQSHSGPSLTPIRTGAARIALLAESRSGWELGLAVQPVGLTYFEKQLFRGGVLAAFGPPFGIADLREVYENDEREAVRQLTERIRQHLEELTLNFEHPADLEMAEVAERLYAREKRLVPWRERDSMARRLPRLKLFQEGIAWLHATDPDRLESLRDEVKRYLRLLTLLGASEGDVPPRYRLGPVLRYAGRQLAMLTLVFPAALVGLLVWLVPYLGSRRASELFRPKLDQIATYKLGAALLFFPLWWTGLCLVGWFARGVPGLVFALVAAPIVGLAAVAWRDRQAQVRQDARVFLRALRLRRGRDRLADLRRSLAAEFDRLGEAWSADRAAAGEELG